MWINGNAYFNGANAWKKEARKMICGEGKAYVHLIEQNGKYLLKTNVYELLEHWTTTMVNSDMLGEAFEPEQRFENPDGSSIVFDRDYFGNERSIRVLPGPFAMEGNEFDLN